MSKYHQICRAILILVSGLVSACAPVGPDFVRPEPEANVEWANYAQEEFLFAPPDSIDWWEVLNDPVLDQLVAAARQNNNNIRIAGLRVLEARAALGIALGNRSRIDRKWRIDVVTTLSAGFFQRRSRAVPQ